MDVGRSVRYLDLADSKENKRAGRVGCTSVLLILCKLAERVGFKRGDFAYVTCLQQDTSETLANTAC
jgi:hypothetical protein